MTSPKAALEGIRVLDFSWAGAGPFATKILADHGAEVIKVETRKRLDIGRMTPPFKGNQRHPDASGLFLHTNTGKLGITLNMMHPKGQALAGKLVEKSDIVMENFTPGVMDRLGLGYGELQKIKPDIIMVSSSIYGHTGPKTKFSGFGNTGAAISGHYLLTGYPDGEPVTPGIAYADVVQPIYTAGAVLAAIDYKRRTGKGQYIDITQAETMVNFLSPAVLDYFANSTVQQRMGNRSTYSCPHGVFPCHGEERWCALAVFTDAHWQGLGRAMGGPDWFRENRFSSLKSRKENEDELERLIGRWTAGFERDILVDILQKEGVPSGAVQDGADLVDRDPQLEERRSFVQLTHPVVGMCNHPAQPFRLSASPADIKTSPCLGEHNLYVFCDILGIPEADYKEMQTEGVFE